MKYNELIVLIPCHSLEDFPTDLGEKPAASLLNGFAVRWHPHLLASSGAFPRWQRADDSLPVTPDRLIIVPLPANDAVPSTWIERARREGCHVITGLHDRREMLEAALKPLGELPEIDADLTADFLALGAIHLHMELLTRHMRNFSQIDEVHMQREALAAAKAAIHQDIPAARSHLKHCFEMLQECRERFYPVDAYLIDLCLLTPDLAGPKLGSLVESPLPVNLMMTAGDWKGVVDKDPTWQDKIRTGIENRTVELIGGELDELPMNLMALDSCLHQLQQGRREFDRLFGAVPVTWARRRFGLGSFLPQILDRFGYKGALHFVLDDGIYPDEEQTNLRWEGRDGSTITAFSRLPLAADSAGAMLRFPVRMAETMDYDHIAAIAFARWPEMKTPYLEDFRRAHSYCPIFGKFVRFAEFFECASSPGRMSDFKAGDYFSPELVLSVAKQEKNGISRWSDYWDRRSRFAAADWLLAVDGLVRRAPSAERQAALELAVEAAHPEATADIQSSADEQIRSVLADAGDSLARMVTSGGLPGEGVLIFNPLSFPRRVVIEWPGNGVPPADPAVVRRQIDDNRVLAQVELPPCGFLWLPSLERSSDNTSPGKTPMAEDLLLRSDKFEVQISDVTGGIAKVMTYRRSPNRISQQIALRFPVEKAVTLGEGEEQETFRTWYTAMRMRESRVLSEGPLIGEIETLGDLLDESSGQVAATYRQITRVTRGNDVIDVDLEIAPAKVPTGAPWTNYIGCRFAWKHPEMALTASMQQGAQAVKLERIEAPQYLELADEAFRTTLLFPGLPFHRKSGDRMLDTLLIVEGETRRRFQFSIALDEKYPWQASQDRFSPPLVLPTQTRPAAGSRQGWFFQTGAGNVQLTRIIPRDSGVVVRLLETEGRTRTVPLECFRTPSTARQIDFQGKTICTPAIDKDRVQVEVGPYEICDVELTFE